MRKHRGKIIATAVIVCVLAATWVFGGNYANRDGASQAPPVTAQTAPTASSAEANVPEPPATFPSEDEAAPSSPLTEASEVPETPAESGDGAARDLAETPATEADAESPETPEAAETSEASEVAAMIIDPETGKDKYLTDPVPEGKPAPVEPQDATLTDREFSATLTVRCDTILGNIKLLDKEKHELVPADGVIFETATVTFHEGESVFNVLQREMKRAKIHMEFMNTPIYNSAYIEGINNLYEFDVGELSGWMYKVNGWYPNYGCSRYLLKDGDAIEWHYTCDLGRDLGVTWISNDR
jgi:hypothetical protein